MPLTITNPFRSLCALLLAVASATAAHAQYQPPPPALTKAPCVPTKKTPCAVDPSDVRPADTVNPFPFPGEKPGEVPDIPTDATPAPKTDAPKPATPTPATPATPGSFPFPGEPAADPPSSSSSSSSSSTPDAATPDDSAPALKDEGSTGSTRFARKHLSKVEDLDTREAKDLEVSHYYVTTGNFQAAYLRAKDAVATIPDDPAAHLALAQTAQRLKKNDEAVAEYNAYLKLEPQGDKASTARKAKESLTKK
jgi:hypothetical protein